MTWETVKKTKQGRPPKSFITFKPKDYKIYLSTQLLNDYFNDYNYVIIRVDKISHLIAIQSVAKQDKNTLKIIKNGRNGYLGGGDIHAKELFKYDFIPKKNTKFIPHWKPKIEWLIIDFNNNGGNNNER